MDVSLILIGKGLFNKFGEHARGGRSLGPAVEVGENTCIHVDAESARVCKGRTDTRSRGFRPSQWLCTAHDSTIELANRPALQAAAKKHYVPPSYDDYVPTSDVKKDGDLDLRVGRSLALMTSVYTPPEEGEELEEDDF